VGKIEKKTFSFKSTTESLRLKEPGKDFLDHHFAGAAKA
tara:strand:+ start:327 stop:443 length:117 start_codon:yes stop_codon:yes gene_type:complete